MTDDEYEHKDLVIPADAHMVGAGSPEEHEQAVFKRGHDAGYLAAIEADHCCGRGERIAKLEAALRNIADMYPDGPVACGLAEEALKP